LKVQYKCRTLSVGSHWWSTFSCYLLFVFWKAHVGCGLYRRINTFMRVIYRM